MEKYRLWQEEMEEMELYKRYKKFSKIVLEVVPDQQK